MEKKAIRKCFAEKGYGMKIITKGQRSRSMLQNIRKRKTFVFMALDKANNVKTFASYMNLGASCDFTNRRYWYISYVANESSNDSMAFGNEVEYMVEGKGNV
jgi:hypothetical protein